MQLRCTYCQTMFSITQDEMLAGLEHMEEQKQTYYDAHCPKCRRANRVERSRMERFFPDWKKVIKTMAKESAQAATVNEKPVSAPPHEAAAPKEKLSSTAKGKSTGAKKK
jgi:phage FluMu protein Com